MDGVERRRDDQQRGFRRNNGGFGLLIVRPRQRSTTIRGHAGELTSLEHEALSVHLVLLLLAFEGRRLEQLVVVVVVNVRHHHRVELVHLMRRIEGREE
jgi:hypothetical protein